MSQQTKKTILVGSVKSRAQKLLLKNKQALRAYWPILLLAQLPALIICLILPFKQTVTTFDKKNNADTSKQLVAHIKNIEHRFNELNQRFVALQIQHAKFIKASILLTATVQQGASPSVNLFKKTTLLQITRSTKRLKIRIHISLNSLHQTLWNDVIDVELAFSLTASLASVAVTGKDSLSDLAPSLCAAVLPPLTHLVIAFRLMKCPSFAWRLITI